MKKFFGALLLLPLVLVVMAQMVSAQDAMSVILPSPYNSRVGSQLLYFFEDGKRDVNTFKTYLTITNTSLDTYVAIHFQYYKNDCTELFDYVDILTPGQTYVIEPSIVKTTPLNRQGQQIRGFATDGRYLLTATAIDASVDPMDLRAIAFNYLTGQIFITNTTTGSCWGTNAISRMAVDWFGSPIPMGTCAINYIKGPFGQFPYAIGSFPALPCAGTGTTLRGFQYDSSYATVAAGQVDLRVRSKFLQMFRPALLYVNHFFEPIYVDPINNNSAFGNRLTMVAFKDNYSTATNWYKLESDSATVTSFVFDNLEQALSVPQRTITCVTEWTISPRTPAGAWTSTTTGQVGGDFLGSSFADHVKLGGWLRMTVTTAPSAQGSLFGWFSQALMAYGNGDLLIGVGRVDAGVSICDAASPANCSTTRLPITDTAPDATSGLTVYVLSRASSQTQ